MSLSFSLPPATGTDSCVLAKRCLRRWCLVQASEGREPRGAAAPLRLQRARGQEEEPRRPEGASPPPPQGQNWNAWGNEVLSVLVKTVKRLQECDVLCLWREPSSLPWSVGAGKAAAAAEQEKGLRLPAGLRPGRATVPGREERPGRA